MSWNLEEFRKLCKAKKLPDSYIYQKAMYWKEVRAYYHSEKSKEIWGKIWNSKEKIEIMGKKWNKLQLGAEAEAEACAQVTNSMPDVLAHIINTSLLKGFLKKGFLAEKHVSIYAIKDKLKKLPGNPTKIEEEIENLLTSDEFKYIRAFVNIIKHYHLVDADWFLNVDKNGGKNGIEFLDFKYKENSYDKKISTYVTEDCRKKFLGHIDKIGNGINDYLK